MEIANLPCLVTGGASGLGEATVRALIAKGGRALIADKQVAAGEALAKELGAAARFVPTDVTEESSVLQALEVVKDTWGPVRGVVNCAGILHAARVVGKSGPYPFDAFERVLRVNVLGTFNVIRLAGAQMSTAEPIGPDGERGVMVNTASIAAFDGQVGQAAYSASKGAIVSMMLPIAREFARLGIRIAAIAPGVFETPMMASLPPEARASLEAQVPFPSRLGRAAEFASLAMHIFENPMINGTTLRLDGALRMS